MLAFRVQLVSFKMLCRGIFLFYLITETIASCAPPQSYKRIVIVGSGASGIAAATKLMLNGFHNVQILEAENRIGGRVNTVKFDDYLVDLGAQWIHGEKGNVVYEIVANMNLTDHSDPYKEEVFTSSGELIDSTMMKNLTDIYIELIDDIINVTVACQRSVGECFEAKLKEHFAVFPELNETMQEQLLWNFNMMQTSLDPADSWYDIAAQEYGEYQTCDGDQTVNWKERGYSTILDILMQKIPDPVNELPVMNKTVLNAEVTKIDYSGEDGKAKITTHDGREFIADHVIVTVSLGVLKEQHETLFNPPLPEYKVNSIKGLGYGYACKIFLAFNDTWFNPENMKNGGYRILWSKEEREELDRDPKRRWMAYALGFWVVEHKPRLLYVWVSGKGGRLMDKVTDDEVYDQCVELLNKFLSKHFNVSKPIGMIRSKWYQKHFRGTYSYRSLETVRTNSSAKQLSEPILKMEKPLILFGGEATNNHQFSTVHGAVATGWREAERLIDFYEKQLPECDDVHFGFKLL